MTGETPALSTRARAILNEFAAAFPQSAHFRGGRKLRKAGWESTFPEIASDVEAREEFLDGVEELDRDGVISVKWRRFRDGTEVDALYLEDPERLFALLGLRSPESVRLEMLEMLDSAEWREGPDILDDIHDHLRATLEASHPLPLDNPSDLVDLARLLRISPADAATLPIRAQSVRLFGDSKRLESLLPIADRLSRRAAGIAVSEHLGLGRSYPEVSIALLGSIVMHMPQLSGAAHAGTWECAGEVVTLPGETIESLAQITGHALDGRPTPVALSVENKESFYTLAARLRGGSLASEIRAVVYCGGHPHRYYVRLLSLLADSGLALYHFGDMDPDGLLILRELNHALQVPVEPWRMDLATYNRYLGYGYRPPASRIELLRTSLDALPESVVRLAREIVRVRTGVEQEVVDLDAEEGAGEPAPPGRNH